MGSAHHNHWLNIFQWFEIFLYAMVSTKRGLFPLEAFLEIYYLGPSHVGEVSAYHLLASALQGWFELVKVSLNGQRDTDRGILKLLRNLMLV